MNGALISKMDTTHANRGWHLATNNGYLSVDLIDSAPQAFKTRKLPPAKFANDKVAAGDLPLPLTDSAPGCRRPRRRCSSTPGVRCASPR